MYQELKNKFKVLINHEQKIKNFLYFQYLIPYLSIIVTIYSEVKSKILNYFSKQIMIKH